MRITQLRTGDLFDLALCFEKGSADISLSEAADRIDQGEKLIVRRIDDQCVLILGMEEIGTLPAEAMKSTNSEKNP